MKTVEDLPLVLPGQSRLTFGLAPRIESRRNRCGRHPGARFLKLRDYLLAHGTATWSQVAEACDFEYRQANGFMSYWVKVGWVKRVSRGLFALPGTEAP